MENNHYTTKLHDLIIPKRAIFNEQDIQNNKVVSYINEKSDFNNNDKIIDEIVIDLN